MTQSSTQKMMLIVSVLVILSIPSLSRSDDAVVRVARTYVKAGEVGGSVINPIALGDDESVVTFFSKTRTWFC